MKDFLGNLSSSFSLSPTITSTKTAGRVIALLRAPTNLATEAKMMPGRRPKSPMRRTTSLNMFSGDIAKQPADQEMMDPPHDQLYNHQLQQKSQPIEPTRAAALAAKVVYRKAVEYGGDRLGWPYIGVGDWLEPSYMAPMLQPRRGRRRNSGDFAMLETGYFLRNCGLCKRRLGTGKDIFMYRYCLRQDSRPVA